MDNLSLMGVEGRGKLLVIRFELFSICKSQLGNKFTPDSCVHQSEKQSQQMSLSGQIFMICVCETSVRVVSGRF